MLEMLRKLSAALADRQVINEVRRRLSRSESRTALVEVGKLEQRALALLADLWNGTDRQRITRVLVGRDQSLMVTGTKDQVDAMAVQMARDTRSCVLIATVTSSVDPTGQGVN